MKRVQIRRPFLEVLKKCGLKIEDISTKIIDDSVKDIKKQLNEARCWWIEGKLCNDEDLYGLSTGFVNGIFYVYALKIKKSLKK